MVDFRRMLYRFLKPEIDGLVTDRLLRFWDDHFAHIYQPEPASETEADRSLVVSKPRSNHQLCACAFERRMLLRRNENK